jgi:hypothetical protein
MAKKTGSVYRCELYVAGHMVHHIQALHSHGEPHRTGILADVLGSVITADFGDEIRHYRNHDSDRLVDLIGMSGTVRVCEGYAILRGAESCCFSILDADEPWVPCDHEPLTSFTPEALTERLRTHGGFLVPGALVIDADEPDA